MKQIKKILEGIYNNPEARKTVVPLFMGNPGLGKTILIKEFAKSVNAHLELFLTSAKPPFEIDGIGIPNTQRTKAKHVEFENLLKLKDGDILFLEEMPNGNPATLNAILTFVESRITAAGRLMPNIMIVAAGNFQGMTPMTPQIKERFVWYPIKFNSNMWQKYMFNKYKMPNNISIKLCKLIKEEDFSGNNYDTPRSLDKAVNMIIQNIPTPYKDTIKPILSSLIKNPIKGTIDLGNGTILEENEQMSWLDLIKLAKGININISEVINEDEDKTKYEILMLNEKKEIVGEILNIEVMKKLYYFNEGELDKFKQGEIKFISCSTHIPHSHLYFQKNK